MMATRSWITAAEASRALQVSRSTLYAYVSRGFIRSERHEGPSRERRYSRDDVERLRARAASRRNPETAATHALQWGLPVLESSITLISDNRLYYRGYDAIELARSRSVAEVASLIWTGRFDTELAGAPRGVGGRARTSVALPFVARAQSVLAQAAARDPLAFDFRPDSVARTGWRILELLSSIIVSTRSHPQAIERRLADAWSVAPRGTDVLRAALILCADHELNVSSFTARCVASSGSSPYAVVIGGLAALEGTRHGGLSVRVESLLASMRRARQIRRALGDRLRNGQSIDGFGHPLYRDGDPRAAALMSLLRQRYPRSAEWVFVRNVSRAAASLLRERPTIDFALAAVARVLRLPPGAPLTLFALGRTIGWLGQAIEQYGTGQIIRPRAKYVGMAPQIAGSQTTHLRALV